MKVKNTKFVKKNVIWSLSSPPPYKFIITPEGGAHRKTYNPYGGGVQLK